MWDVQSHPRHCLSKHDAGSYEVPRSTLRGARLRGGRRGDGVAGASPFRGPYNLVPENDNINKVLLQVHTYIKLYYSFVKDNQTS